MNNFIKSIFLLIILNTALVIRAEELDVKDIIKKIDELYRSDASTATVEMEIITPHWQRTLTMNIWTKGMKKTFIRILEPKKERGVATLRIGNEMWNFLPKVNKIIKIPPSMMMGSWMGSDFTNDDLVKESTMLDDYHFSLITPDNALDDLLYIQLMPREGKAIVWGKLILAVRKNDYIPVKEEYYDEKEALMRVLNFTDIKTVDNRRIPCVMEMIPQNNDGHKTIIRYKTLTFNAAIDEDIFTLRNLRSFK